MGINHICRKYRVEWRFHTAWVTSRLHSLLLQCLLKSAYPFCTFAESPFLELCRTQAHIEWSPLISRVQTCTEVDKASSNGPKGGLLASQDCRAVSKLGMAQDFKVGFSRVHAWRTPVIHFQFMRQIRDKASFFYLQNFSK